MPDKRKVKFCCTKSRANHAEFIHGSSLFVTFVVLSLFVNICHGQWRVPEAVLCYQLEQDFGKARLPDIPVHKVSPEYQDSSRNFYMAPQDGKNVYNYVNGVHYTYFLAMNSGGKVEYKMAGRFDRFVATVGLEDGADDSARVKVSVLSGDKEIYSSGQITKHSRPVEINVKIPVECRVLKLVTNLEGGRARTVWANAGFTLKTKAPQVAQCELYVPDEYGDNFDVAFISPAGQQIPGRVCSGYPHRPLKVQFDTTAAGLSDYFAYIIPKAGKQGKLDNLWYGKGGLTLETRLIDKDKDRCDRLPGFVEAWKNDSWIVDSSFTDGIFHSWPVTGLDYGHDLFNSSRSSFGQYYYIGYFNVEENGEYSFATCSRWPSTVFIDDKFVVHWLGRHDFHGGRRCEYSGTVTLTPGIHKIEYMNFNKWGELYALCAWRKGSDVYRIMTGCDFVPQAYYKPSKVFAKDAAAHENTFAWHIVDDIRMDAGGPAIVAVELEVIPAKSLKDPSYRWEFDDGIIAMGQKVDHVFIRKGLHKIRLVVNDGDKAISNTEQTINVDIARDKLFCQARDSKLFNNIISKVYLQHVAIDDLVYFYNFADRYGSDQWKLLTAEVICGKKDDKLLFDNHLEFYLSMISYLESVETGRYDLAINLSKRILASVDKDSSSVSDIRLMYLRLLLDYAGDYVEAEKQKALLPTNLDFGRQKQFEVLRAELQLAGPGGTTQLKFSEPLGSTIQLNKLKVRIAGDLRFADQCCESDERNVVQQGMDRLSVILRDDPSYILDAEFNLVRLKLWQAAEGWSQLYYIAKRCERMEMSDIFEPELLAFQVLALYKSDKTEMAEKVLQKLKGKWPYSPETAKSAELLKE